MTHYPSHSKIYHIKSDSLALDNSKINKDPVPIKPLITNTNTTTQFTNINKMPENSNPLSGLLGQYDSDSDHENVNGQESLKLDAKVDNFLQEINQIAPKPNTNNTHDEKQFAWQECFDDSTGYPYYWNIETNAVTWEMPPEYKQWLTKNQTKNTNKIVPTIGPDTENRQIMQSTENKIQQSTDNKIPQNTNNKIPPTTDIKIQQKTNNKIPQNRQKHKKKIVKKAFEGSGSSDDEKIVMITSFSEESSSESENETPQKEIQNEEKKIENCPQNKIVLGPYIEDIPKQVDHPETKKEIIENIKDENIDETVILARLRTQAKVLHELGGELPKSVDKTILAEKLENKPQSLCLVAGYGDDSDHSDVEDETLFKKTIFPIPEIKETNETKQTESTLFPVTVPIDVKQFEICENTKQIVDAKDPSEELIDNKAFKRKKRLGLTFDVKKTKVEEHDDLAVLGESRKGFGFQSSNENSANVKKSGIAFIKADVLNSNDSSCNSDIEDFTEIKSIVTEKVNFLGEGKDPVSAVQTMLIQLQTLEAAYNVQALTKAYLYSWLRETSTGLEKLEQEAAPEGWTCQWDRSHKRYFYRNTASGETQWHYPELEAVDPDIVGGGEAMDICTTPPPNEDVSQQSDVPATTRKGNERLGTPPPPRIQDSPSPPPPPSITTTNNDVQPPIPTAPPPDDAIPPPPPTITENNQPLPPGVDTSDLPYFAAKLKELSSKNETNRDSLGSELDSFYSDIAQLEASSSQGSLPEIQETKSVSSPSSVGVGENPTDLIVKKKKKSKKIGQGINMKKKAVSSLVEKWKKVQNDY